MIGLSLVGKALLATVAALALTSLVAAQTPASPPPGDPAVLEMFFRHHDLLVQEIEKQRLSSSSAADAAEKGAAGRLGIDVAGFRRISSSWSASKAQLDTLDAEGRAYVADLVKQGLAPDIRRLEGFETRRKAILASARTALQASLTPSGWAALNSFIDGEFRNAIKRSPAK